MSDYTAPIRDMRFTLDHVAGLPALLELEAFAHADPDLVTGLLEEAGRWCAEAVGPTNREGDQHGTVLEDGEVRLPASFERIYQQYVDAGWGALQHPVEFGGGGLPLVVATAFKEMLNAANLSFSLGPLLTVGTVVDLLEHGSEEQQQTYLPRLISGQWSGTMNLTEPNAGSDVGALKTRAVPQDDGTYRITGQKIFITFGEHQLTENIIHLVLARLPDAPAGTKGISLFLVPKFLVDEDGTLGERNDVTCVSVEHKLGIHAAPTCVMAYGEHSQGAVGYLVGGPHEGMRQMFTMMNDARLNVGLQGVAIAERAYQDAVAFAVERRQSRAPQDDDLVDGQSRIVQHPDVRRMLLTMKAQIEAARALCYVNAAAIDRSHHGADETEREQAQKVADLLTPMSKAWCTDLGVELTSLAIQVHGGMGYIEETGVAQHYRDARIAPIYEGTNAIQALDLVGRKLPYDGGTFVKTFIAEVRDEVASLDGAVADLREPLATAVGLLSETTDWLFAHREDARDLFAGATPYLRLFATVLGGVYLGRGAAAASRLLADEPSESDATFLDAKVVTARFYVEQILPEVTALAPKVTAGAADLYAIDAAAFAR